MAQQPYESEQNFQTTEPDGNGRNYWLVIGGLFLLGLALALLLFGSTLFGNDTASEETADLQQIPSLDERADAVSSLIQGGAPLNVGDVAHDFVLRDPDGNQVALSDFRGRPVIVNFWATWCAPCRIEMPELQRTFEAHEEQGLMILAINQAEQPDTVRNFFYDEFGLTFIPLLDEETMVSEAYGAINLPTTFFINADGEVTAIHRGIIAEAQIEAYLAETLQ